MKFGGTSLKNAEMFRQSARIVLDEPREKIVVVSAMAGVTDQLVALIEKAKNGEDYSSAMAQLEKLHIDLIGDLFVKNDGELWEARASVESIFAGMKGKLGDIENSQPAYSSLRPFPFLSDSVLARGEELSSIIFSAVLRDLKNDFEKSIFISSAQIKTDENFGEAEIDLVATKHQLADLSGRLSQGVIPVVPGFIGTTVHGDVTTLGRNGSDYTAAALASIFGAAELQIWKDVDGVMQTDPKIVPKAKVLAEISYEEAMEMTYFGAKILHPKSVLPAIENKIPIRIKNTYRPKAIGTLISSEAKSADGLVKIITTISGLALINVVGRGMLGVSGIAARVFGATAKAGVNVMMISQASSEHSICFVVRQTDAEKAVQAMNQEFEMELQRHLLEKVDASGCLAIIAIVGDGMKGFPGTAAKFTSALAKAKVNIIAMAQGSSERNISILISSDETAKAVKSVYQTFFSKRKEKK
ncbi:MAG: aspartate kinase [Patescibacteria group bacterium]